MRAAPEGWVAAQAGRLRILHRPDLEAALVAAVIERHRANAARRNAACEHWSPSSSVSRVCVDAPQGTLDLAVKWSHWRGVGRGFGQRLRGSKAARSLAGCGALRGAGVSHPEPLAIAEGRWRGLVRESFLLTRFVPESAPLPAVMPELLAAPHRRRAVAAGLGNLIGRLHANDLDHTDLKHSNFLLAADDTIVLLDLDALVRRPRLAWTVRVRALGQLEAYASDLYPDLPLSDRLRFLRAYLEQVPELSTRRRELVDAVAAWARARLAEWSRRDRSASLRYPLAPRSASGARPRPARRSPGRT